MSFQEHKDKMNEQDRWEYLISLDEELLQGGVILPEWCSFIVREADIAFTAEANLASILTAVSAIETYLKAEYSTTGNEKLVKLIDQASIDPDLRTDLHTVRRFRNKWVHVDDPWDDKMLIEMPDDYEDELANMAFFAMRCLRRTIYENPIV